MKRRFKRGKIDDSSSSSSSASSKAPTRTKRQVTRVLVANSDSQSTSHEQEPKLSVLQHKLSTQQPLKEMSQQSSVPRASTLRTTMNDQGKLRKSKRPSMNKESDEESEHSAEIPPMTQKEKKREAKRESMLRYVQKWDEYEEAALRFDRFPTKRKLSPKELRQLQREKEIRRRKREIKKKFVSKEMEKEYIKTMDELKKKYEEASKRQPKAGKRRYDPKVASIYDQVIEAKHKKADKKAKEWAPLIGMESEQNNVIRNMNRIKQGSHLNDIIFCDSQGSSIDSMIERKQKYTKAMKDMIDEQSDFTKELADAYELDEIDERIRHLEAIQREYGNKQMNPARIEKSPLIDDQCLNPEGLTMEMDAIDKDLKYLSEKQKHMQKAANKKKKESEPKKMGREHDGMRNGLGHDLQHMGDGELKIDHPAAKDVVKLRLGLKKEMKSLKRDMNLKVDPPKEQTRKAALIDPERSMDNAYLSEIMYGNKQKNEANELEKLRQENIELTSAINGIQSEHEAMKKERSQRAEVALNGGLKQMKKQKGTQILKTKMIEVPWGKHDIYEKTEKKSRMRANSEEIITDCITIVGRNRVYLQRKISANLNNHFIEIGTKRFGYNEIYKVMKYKDSAKKWVMLTKYGMVIISASSSKMRKVFVSLIRSRISECFRVF